METLEMLVFFKKMYFYESRHFVSFKHSNVWNSFAATAVTANVPVLYQNSSGSLSCGDHMDHNVFFPFFYVT